MVVINVVSREKKVSFNTDVASYVYRNIAYVHFVCGMCIYIYIYIYIHLHNISDRPVSYTELCQCVLLSI